MIKTIYLLVLILFSSLAYAGSTYTGTVKPYFWAGGLYLQPINAKITSKPACATRTLLRLRETDPNDPIFRYKFSILLSAWMAKREVTLYGTGECTSEGDEIIFVVMPN